MYYNYCVLFGIFTFSLFFDVILLKENNCDNKPPFSHSIYFSFNQLLSYAIKLFPSLLGKAIYVLLILRRYKCSSPPRSRMSLGMLAELMPNPVQLCPTTSSWIAPRLAKNIHGECTFYGRWIGR